ncbi:MAG: hypothetical protein GX205_06180 [Firmicutes bacterium]|nr:hypothetical protein [Bacillota bacterium]
MTEMQLPQSILPFEGTAHYLGSYPKNGELYDYYEVICDGETTFVYVKAEEVKQID